MALVHVIKNGPKISDRHIGPEEPIETNPTNSGWTERTTGPHKNLHRTLLAHDVKRVRHSEGESLVSTIIGQLKQSRG